MKNKILMSIIAVLAIVLSVSVASAAVSVSGSYDEDNPVFGSASQMASNPNADDEDDENIYDTATITLASTEASNLTVSSITVDTERGFSNTDDNDEGYINITLDSSTTITANSTGTATLRARIPEALDAVNDDLEEVAIKVAVVTFNLDNGNTTTMDVYMQRKNMLEIKESTITIDGDDEDLDDGDDFEARPGDEITIEVEAENTYDEDDDDVEIEDVEFLVEADDGDLDFDEDDDIGDMDPEEEAVGSVTFTLENDIDEDDYEIFLSIEGEDEHGAKHGEKWEIELEVDKKTHDIVIESASISDESVSCMRGENSIRVKLANLGKKDEDEVSLYVENSDLSLDYSDEDIEIEEGEDYTKTVSFTVPEDLEAGTYNIRVSAYYSGDEDDGVLGDMKEYDLTVTECAVEEEETTTPDTTTDDGTEVTPIGDSQVEVTVPQEVLDEFGVTETEEDKPFTESAGFIVLLTVLVMASLGGVITLTVFLVKAK